MTQYIDKDALDTVLRRLWKKDNGLSNAARDAYNGALQDIQCEIDALEVKEVDLEKVIEEYFKGWTDDYDNGGAACHYQYVQVNDCKAIAKHFFELGLKAQKGK